MRRDEELLKNSLVDKEVFGELIQRYEAKLGRYINRLGIRNHEDQQDVLQEVFLKVYKNSNNFDAKLSFSSWIYRIAHNEAISWYRKTSVRPEGHLVNDSEDVFAVVSSKELSADTIYDQAINANELAKALEEIDIKYKEVLVLRFFEHKEYDEISDILMIPTGSVGTLLHRGKKQLASVLNKESLRI